MDVRKKARVVAVFGDRYKVTCDLDELTVKLKGKFYYNNESANLPCVGDWVYIED